jgi:hypothetical protein
MGTMLMEVDTEECTITTLDGKKYNVEPSDIAVCCTWTPTTEIEIATVGGKKVCKNLSSGQSIRLM